MLELRAARAQHGLTKPVDLSFEAGAMTAIIGANGAGKTTLLKLLVGHLEATEGQVLLHERALSSFNDRARARRIAYLPQFEDRPAGFTVEDLVQLGRFSHRSLWGGGDARHLDAVQRAMDALDVSQWRHRPIETLSGGEYQRVRLARCLAQEADILVLDEPAAHLDLSRGRSLLERLYKVSESDGLTVIVAIHDLNLASVFFRRLIALRDGWVVSDGRPADVLSKDELSRVFEPGLEVVAHPKTGVPQVLPAAPRFGQ